MKESSWTEARVREMIAANSFSYQNVALPYGLSTGGKDRTRTADIILPADMEGRSVIDIGCGYGFFCFAAEDRGAGQCVGADINPENLRKCRLLAECRGSDVEFVHLDIETKDIPEQFDYVLCLNVLHHVRNPIGVLEKLIAATREKLILEIASFGPRDRKKNGVSRFAAGFLRRFPIIYVAGTGARRGRSGQTFFLSEPAIRAILTGHRATFGKVDFIDTGHKGRYIVIAQKRKIDHLVVVAGVQASGKSRLIDALVADPRSPMAQQLGMDTNAEWGVQQFGNLGRKEPVDTPSVVLHYNISKHLIDGDIYQHNRALNDLISTAKKVTFVTMWTPPPQLLENFKRGRTNNWRKFILSQRHRKKTRRLLEMYENEASLHALYDDWFAFLQHYSDPGFVATYEPEYRLTPVNEWLLTPR